MFIKKEKEKGKEWKTHRKKKSEREEKGMATCGNCCGCDLKKNIL